ncbi:MAG: transposase [Syntrophobacteraceae bacterium]
MIGRFIAHETVDQCPACSLVFHSETLLRLVASRCNVAYDVLVFVGEALFRRHRNSQEVRAELIARNVRLCASEIEYLGRKFIMYPAVGHKVAMPRIRQAMKLAGGYVLHIDAMHEGEAPALMTGIDSLSKIVLANVKLASEHADHIVPFLRKLRADYETPSACVHDMGAGILKAIAEVFPGTRDFICHFHFLRDIGKDLLEPAYAQLRQHLRNHATSSRLHALARDMRQCLAPVRNACKGHQGS